MLKPKDIHEVQFSRAFKGYDPDEVDKFLDRVTEDYSQLFRENAELMNKIDTLASKLSEFKNAEESLRAAKEKIYRMAQEVASKAKAEAAQTEREAKERAERIVIEAKRDCENQRRLYERLQLEVTRFKAKSIALFKSEIEQLNSLPDIQMDAKDELRIRADEMSTEDTFSSPFVEEYKPKNVSPSHIDFGVLEADENQTKAKENEAAALKATADPKEDFTSDYTKPTSREDSMFSPHARSGYTQEEIFISPAAGDTLVSGTAFEEPVIEEEPVSVEPVVQEEVTQTHADETEYISADVEEVAEPVSEAPNEKTEDVKTFDIPEEPASKPAFTIRRVTEDNKNKETEEHPAPESQNDENTVTAKEIADSFPEVEEPEGRMENGWYNETEEFDLVDTDPQVADKTEKETNDEHPKFGQLRFGADYDISEEDGGSSHGFGFFKKKK